MAKIRADKALGNVITLSSVVLDDNDMPVSFRLMPFGAQSIRQNGVKLELNFTREHAEAIYQFWTERSSDLVIDTEHMAYLIARELKVEETELTEYWLDKVAIGWWKPEVREDGLYAVVTKWNELGTKLIKESLFRWFSPVIKGISEGNLRITSLAAVNTPGLDNLDAIAASGELEHFLNQHKQTQNRGQQMDPKLKAALMSMFGNSLVLSEGGELDTADVVAKITKMHTDHTGLVATAKEALALSADADVTTIQGMILSTAEKAKKVDDITKERDALALSAETAKKADLLAKAKKEGRKNRR